MEADSISSLSGTYPKNLLMGLAFVLLDSDDKVKVKFTKGRSARESYQSPMENGRQNNI